MIHLVGLPHTSLDEEEFSTCAFTTKAARWTRVLELLGRDVTAYWSAGKTTVNCEVVDILSRDEREKWFGTDVGKRLPDIFWDATEEYWRTFNQRAIAEVRKRLQPGDLVAVMAGSVQQSVVDVFAGEALAIEPAVGYGGIAQNTFCCFESYAWMHYVYGNMRIGDGRSYDAVVPNFVEPDAFSRGPDEGYLLFLGRVTERKGPHVAAQIAEVCDRRLVVAGAGGEMRDLELYADGGRLRVGRAEYQGPVGPDARRKLLAGASALIVPTLYIEPFGTVHVEALMSGVPVVASDWGVFTETVREGVDGFRFRTLRGGAEAANGAIQLRGPELRESAIERFSLEAVADRFDVWIDMLEMLAAGRGWDSLVG